MIHIIDGNNLAGQLKMLVQKNFDKALIIRLKDFYRSKRILVHLVFDGHDALGDRSQQGSLTIYYSPQDRFYRGADDKIIELIRRMAPVLNDDLVLVTGDRELITRAQETMRTSNKKIIIKSSADFADKLIIHTQEETCAKEEMPRAQSEKINQELLDLWGK